MSTNPCSQWTKKIAISLGSASLCFSLFNLDAKAEAASLLWWDSSAWLGGTLADPLRQEMPDFLNEFDGGDLFNATYISSKTPGEFATHMESHSYDVIVFDSGNHETVVFNEADGAALQAHYSNNSNLMLDGSLIIRSFNYAPATDFPGPNGALAGFLANQVYQLAERGGGIMIGTDHNIFQFDGNTMLSAIVPGAAFRGVTNPSSDGVFYGTDLLNSVASVAPADVFTHWSSAPSQGVSPTGEFADFLGNPITLYSQVDVANKPGGGPKYSYISTSWEPGSEITSVTDQKPPESQSVPEPSSVLGLLAFGAVGLTGMKRKKQQKAQNDSVS